MRLVTQRVNAEVKYKKISTTALVQRPTIIMRTSDGKLVHNQRITDTGEVLNGFRWKLIDEEGKEVSKKDVHYFQVRDDGTEVEVSPSERTKEIRVVKEVPATSMNGMLVESTYELFHTDDSIVSALYQEAERYWKKDIVGIALFSWGLGFKQYYAVVRPILTDKGFVWLMELTQTKKEYQHLMPIPAKREPSKKPPTIAVLPEISAIVKS